MVHATRSALPPFVPGQVCCHVAVPAHLDGAAVRTLYAAFAEAYNAVMPGVLDHQHRRAQATHAQATLLRELTRERMARLRSAAAGAWLTALPDAGAAPYASVRRAGGTSATFLYRVFGPGHSPAEGAAAEAAAALVLDLVMLSNISQRPLNDAIARHLGGSQAPIMRAMVPNWLFGVTPPEPHIEGGPGSIPEPADEPADGGFDFLDIDLAPAPTEPVPPITQGPVEPLPTLVAVLDTSPTPDALRAAAVRFPRNALLATMASSVTVDDAPWTDPAAFGDVDGIHAARVTDSMPTVLDHGLFVAGIVRAVAGDEARIHLVRVLSERGVGSLMHILHALTRLPRLLQAPGAPRHLIVNLSLVAEVPSHAVLMRWLLPETAGDADAMLGDMEDAVRLLEAMSLPLRETLDWLIDRDVLVVAAAGNHGRSSPGTRHATQEPARFDNVLAVAATDSAHRSAGFSNRGDMIVMGDGVATFGGNAGPDGRLVALDGDGPKRFDAPIGLYTAPRVGASDADNATGWAYWAGTSFAAPIITGLAARLWHQDPELTARQVMGAVRSVARSSEAAADLDVPVVRVVQRD